jgi:hypothetical protein
VKIVLLVEIVAVVVPAAHIGAGSGHTLANAEGFEEAVFVEIEEELVILFELGAERAVEELDLGIAEDRDWGSDGNRGRGTWAGPRRKRADREEAGGGNSGGLEELAPGLIWLLHDEPPEIA